MSLSSVWHQIDIKFVSFGGLIWTEKGCFRNQNLSKLNSWMLLKGHFPIKRRVSFFCCYGQNKIKITQGGFYYDKYSVRSRNQKGRKYYFYQRCTWEILLRIIKGSPVSGCLPQGTLLLFWDQRWYQKKCIQNYWSN